MRGAGRHAVTAPSKVRDEAMRHAFARLLCGAACFIVPFPRLNAPIGVAMPEAKSLSGGGPPA